MKYIFNIFKFFLLLLLCNFLGMKIFELFSVIIINFGPMAEFLFVSTFVLTAMMFLYGCYGFLCSLFHWKKIEIFSFLNTKEKPQYD